MPFPPDRLSCGLHPVDACLATRRPGAISDVPLPRGYSTGDDVLIPAAPLSCRTFVGSRSTQQKQCNPVISTPAVVQYGGIATHVRSPVGRRLRHTSRLVHGICINSIHDGIATDPVTQMPTAAPEASVCLILSAETSRLFLLTCAILLCPASACSASLYSASSATLRFISRRKRSSVSRFR